MYVLLSVIRNFQHTETSVNLIKQTQRENSRKTINLGLDLNAVYK